MCCKRDAPCRFCFGMGSELEHQARGISWCLFTRSSSCPAGERLQVKHRDYHLYRTPVTTSSAELCACAWLALYPPVVCRCSPATYTSMFGIGWYMNDAYVVILVPVPVATAALASLNGTKVYPAPVRAAFFAKKSCHPSSK